MFERIRDFARAFAKDQSGAADVDDSLILLLISVMTVAAFM
jgi:Flp pilus assembly pilin Flp